MLSEKVSLAQDLPFCLYLSHINNFAAAFDYEFHAIEKGNGSKLAAAYDGLLWVNYLHLCILEINWILTAPRAFLIEGTYRWQSKHYSDTFLLGPPDSSDTSLLVNLSYSKIS